MIGARIRQARLSARPPVTQEDLVARLQTQGLNIDQAMISRIESGQRPVSDFEVVAFSKALKVKTSWLLEGDNGG
ncbi:Helix-turn-helix domain protein [Dehalogenimonas alkenigignens]|uniref:Helix-turn-helix domain protein n=1 Tax=Dehalogenimonas alkenigignens TaxID=1217799 RepID=A0A0W0GL75_9CHLR|nr:Helix-turn-helix domain protein [Dehalogenimonas alkenigignens]